MKKYKWSRYSDKIEEIEAIRETAQCIFIKVEYFGKTEERKLSKDSHYEKYFDTLKEALLFLKVRLERSVEVLASSLKENTEKLEETVKMLTEV